MNIFADQLFLYLGVILLVLMSFLFFWREKKKKKKILLLTSSKLLSRLVPHFSPIRNLIKFGIFLIGVLMLFMALARPQWGIAQRSSRPTGIDLIIALDVSKSMLARDIRPNRLERVKLTISNLIGNLKAIVLD